ncbi:MAG: outer membrane protein assembly factor BamE, partial [Actinomycetota bacterium]|nr:outer membrane protein assembly factor BamE [Actinomycetota bacterium]
GVKGDGATLGVLVNAANNKETGHFWKMGACKSPFGARQSDNQQYNLGDDGDDHFGRDSIFGAILATAGETGVAPAYAEGPQCNAIGLTSQGKIFLDGMVKRGMVFDPDHMSAYARQASLDLLAKRGYSGVVSSHSWADDANYFKILKMGGVVTPYAGDSSGFLGKWELLRTKADPRFLYGIGWGSDINGFGAQGSPRNPAPGKGVTYPFTTLGGAKVDKLTTGKRTWNVNTDGVAGYGLYPDWVQDVTVQAGKDAPAFRRDLANGAEAYLQMWERANGITGDSCRADIANVTKGDLGHVKKGMTPEQVVTVLGQPHTRIGRAFTYCGTSRTLTVRFTKSGKVA